MLKQEQMKDTSVGQFQVSQKAVIYDVVQKKFLLAKQTDDDLVFTRKFGSWDFFGGRIDQGENIGESLQREIEEESSLQNCEIGDVLGLYPVENQEGPLVLVGHLVFYSDGEITLSDEHTEYVWLTAEDIENSTEIKPWMKQFVQMAQKRLQEQEYLNDLKRLQADFDNYKKRQNETQKELGAYLIEKLVMEIIPVLDNFRMSNQHVPETSKSDPWVVGIQYIEKQLEDVLTANGMQVIDVQEGDMFDPRLHEAVSQADTEKEKEDSKEGKIQKVLQKGYRLGEKIVRPAKVVVS